MAIRATNSVKIQQKNTTLKIKTLMIEKEVEDDDVANGIDMEISVFDKKINGLDDWKLSESKKLCNFFNVELSYIFL